MLIFILFTIGFGFIVFFLFYRQVLGGIIDSYSMFVRHVISFLVMFFGFLYIGYLTASSLRHLVGFAPQWLGIVLFLFIGLKAYRTILQVKTQNWIYDTKQNNILFAFLLAHSFDFFIGGIALGFYSMYQSGYFILLASIFTIFLYVAYILGRRNTATQSVWIIALIGCILISVNSLIGVIEMIVGSM
jgi:putative Mn2+ efflux pump MntP